MYVRVGLYFLDIILDIALIQRLPKLEKMRCPRTCGRRVVEDKKEREKKNIYGVSETIISNIFNQVCVRDGLSVSSLLELKKKNSDY